MIRRAPDESCLPLAILFLFSRALGRGAARRRRGRGEVVNCCGRGLAGVAESCLGRDAVAANYRARVGVVASASRCGRVVVVEASVKESGGPLKRKRVVARSDAPSVSLFIMLALASTLALAAAAPPKVNMMEFFMST